MRVKELSRYLEQLEKTPKRLEITSILSRMLEQLDLSDTRMAVYLSLGYLKAPFENLKFNIADKMMLRIIEQAYSGTNNILTAEKVTALYKEAGDLGNVCYILADDSKKNDMGILPYYEKLKEIALISGTGSQELKIKKTSELLSKLDKLSAKFTARIILGITRLGFTELTLIDALALTTGNKENSSQIEKVYNIHPDIGLIAEKIKEKGMRGLSNIKLETGVPVLSQKAQRLSGPEEAIEKMDNVWAEYKFDGTRVQLHLDRNKKIKGKDVAQTELLTDGNNDISVFVKTFTRNLEETTHQYPDLVNAAIAQVKAESVILDGEAIGYSRETGEFLPFQETIQRKRKHNIGDTAKNIPLKYFVFDILLLNGDSLISKPLTERRKILDNVISEGAVISIDEHLETASSEELEDYFNLAIHKNLEGLVVKKPDDSYQAGARSYSWVKLKKTGERLIQDSVDCVVLGYYAGKGVRSKFGIGGFLVGVRDEKTDTFKTITKIGTGLSDEDWAYLKEKCDKYKTDKLPQNVEMDKIFLPDVIIAPKIVVEIIADEISLSPTHTAGYALRFPRLLKFREDKNASDSTSLREIAKMYKAQRAVKE